MLIVPMTGKMSRKNPPWVTLVLILVNCLVYFVIQSGDNAKYEDAFKFYFVSGLAEIETGYYVDYLKASNRANEVRLPPGVKKNDPEVLEYIYSKMMEDRQFVAKLNEGRIVPADTPVYAKWKDLKAQFERKLSDIIGHKYGYKPGDPGPVSAFAYMFLHGSASHLIGNMLFLWLVGCSLELAGIRYVYLALYLVTGVISAVAFGIVYPGGMIPLVGASGAISGIIGAYTVLFGKNKVRIFYSIGVYFNYTKVSAILLLPAWIGNELFQLFFGGVSNVAYVGHLGGLVSGAALGFAYVKLRGGIQVEDPVDERHDKAASLIEQGLQKFSELDLKGARALVQEALKLDPDNRTALTHLFNIEKSGPGTEEFHRAAGDLLVNLQRDEWSRDELLKIFDEYCRVAKQPRLEPELCARLSSAFSAQGRVQQAERATALLLNANPGFPAVPTVLLNLSRAYIGSGMREKGEKCLRFLCSKYPESSESVIARGLIKEPAA